MDTDPVASSSGLRQLRERKKRKYDFDDSSSDEEQMQQKRAARRKSSGTPSTHRNKRSGKLACFVDMPLDVLHEIFGHLHPYDLLRLTRTTKEFRRILLHKSSISTWRATFDDVSPLPDCPSEMSEPAWANLVFSPHCHVCLTSWTSEPNPLTWSQVLFGDRGPPRRMEIPDTHLFQVFPFPVASFPPGLKLYATYNLIRLIEVDSNGTLSELYRDIPGGLGPLPGMVDGLQDMFTLLPNRLGKRYKRVFLRRQLVEFRDVAQNLSTAEEKSTFLKNQYDWTQELNMHAANCEAWAHNQADDRSEELTRLRKERQTAIVKKFEELGFRDDIHWRGAFLSRENFANKPQRLTDRIWKNIKPEALRWIEGVRQQRQNENHKLLVLSRKGIASKYLRNYKNARLPCTDIFPEPPDFCEFEPVKRLCHQPVDVPVDLSTFDSLNKLMPELLKTWREKVHAGIRDVLLKSMTATFTPGQFNLPDWTNDPVALRRKMALATTVFVCERCNGNGTQTPHPLALLALDIYDYEDEYFDFDDAPRAVKPLFYPEVMAHPCLTRFPLRNSFLLSFLDYEASPTTRPNKDPSIDLEGRIKQRQKWIGDYLRLDKHAAKVAEKVVALAGLDPASATTEDMDRLDARFQCTDCPYIPRIRGPTPPVDENGEQDDPDIVLGPEKLPVMTWRLAVKHQIDRHVQGVNPGSMMLPAALRQPTIYMDTLRLLPPTSPALVGITAKEKEKLETVAEVWCCALCRDTPQEDDGPVTLPEVKIHVKRTHRIDEPTVDRDFYKHFAAKDLANTQECVVAV